MLKRFYLLFIIALTLVSCGTARHTNQRVVNEAAEISYVLSNYYPHLYNYYLEGVLKVKSLREIPQPDGTLDYDIKYQFVRYYIYDFNEQVEIVRKNFPELYRLCVIGATDINEVYKYVDKRTGKVRYHVSYWQVYDLYYYHYPVPYVGPRFHRPLHMGVNHPKPHPQSPPARTPNPAPQNNTRHNRGRR